MAIPELNSLSQATITELAPVPMADAQRIDGTLDRTAHVLTKPCEKRASKLEICGGVGESLSQNPSFTNDRHFVATFALLDEVLDVICAINSS